MIKNRNVGQVSKGPYGLFHLRNPLAVFIVLGALVYQPSAAQVPPASTQPSDDIQYVPTAPGSSKSREAAALADLASDDEAELEMPQDAEMTPEKQQALVLLQLHVKQAPLQRAPSAVIEALADRAAAATRPAENAAVRPSSDDQGQGDADQAAMLRIVKNMQEFRTQVITGDWQSARDYLITLPEGVRSKVYGHLLILLAADQNSVVLTSEIVPLADASPTELTPAQLAALGGLLRRSAAKLGRPESLLASVRSGTRRLGGVESTPRLAAARMFFAAGMLDEAGGYLPSLAEALKLDDPAIWNFLATYQHAVGKAKSDPAAILSAWLYTTRVLDPRQRSSELRPAQRAEAIRNVLGLWPQLPRDVASRWLGELFSQQPDLGLFLLAEVGRQVESAAATPDQPARRQALSTLRQVVVELSAAAGDDLSRWSTPLEMLTAGWLREAERTDRGPSGNPSYNQPQRRVARSSRRAAPIQHGPFGYASNDDTDDDSGGESKPDNVPPLTPEDMLPLVPDEAWCRAIDPDLARRVRYLAGAFAARSADRDRLVEALASLGPADEASTRRLVEQYVRSWTERVRNGQAGHARGIEPGATPLTRARQARNLAHFNEMLTWLRRLAAPPPADDVLVDAFDACHSPAEVYREDDVRQAFGEPEALGPRLAASLAARLRENLAGAWRLPEVQDRQGTRRTEAELVAEVTRGYHLAERVLTSAVAAAPGEIGPRMLLAVLEFDQAEFLYGQNVDLATYTAMRDRAFDGFRESADVYAQGLRQEPAAKPSIAVYQQWFDAALGASDLAYLTRQDQPDRDQIDRVAACLADAGERHLALFGKAVIGAQHQLPPQLKPRYLREALRVLGDHPSGEPARALVRYYDELLSEVQLHLAIDGSDRVGHGRRFGVRFSLRTSRELGRESDGFDYLLVNQPTYAGNTEVNHREQLERELREKLAEACEVESITFHEPGTQPRGFGREGWQETPLAYLVLRAKDPAIDRLPVVQIDLPFSDGAGMVILPIPSQVVLLDAREPQPPPRPMRELKLKQVLDDRQGDVVRLEVLATAKGLLPELDSLLELDETHVQGYRVRQVHDQGFDVATLDLTGERVEPISERSWLVELEPSGEAPPAEFTFPPAFDAAAELSYSRYDDADVVEAAATVPLRRGLLAGGAWRRLALPALVVGGLLLLALTVRILVGKRRRIVAPIARYQRPARLTPFNLVVLLKRIDRDDVLELSPAERSGLGETIDSLERDFFGAPTESPAARDLGPIVDRWLARAVNGLANGTPHR